MWLLERRKARIWTMLVAKIWRHEGKQNYLLEQSVPLAPMNLYLWQFRDISSKCVSRYCPSFKKKHSLPNPQNSFNIILSQKAILPLFFHLLTRLLKRIIEISALKYQRERKREETKKNKSQRLWARVLRDGLRKTKNQRCKKSTSLNF